MAAMKNALEAQACCQRKRAASIAKAYIATTEISHGMELKRPIWKSPRSPICAMMLGSQKVAP